jgi:hypothetical protein
MSVFLVIVEFGPKAHAPRPHPPLQIHPIAVRPRGAGSAPRTGYLVTDGVSAGRLQVVGRGSVAHLGDTLRASCQALIRERLALGLQVAIVFIFAEGELQEVVCDVGAAPTIEIEELPARLPTMNLGEPAWVSSHGA